MVSQITKKAIPKKVKEFIMNQQKWSSQEEERLRKNYPTKSIDELDKLFPDRTRTSIEKKAARLGLAKDQKEEIFLPDDLSNQLIKVVKKQKKISLRNLCNELNKGPQCIESEISRLIDEGYNLEIDISGKLGFSKEIPRQKKLVLKTEDYFGDDWIRFGFVADTHLCSKYQRLDVLNALYDIYEKEGIQTVYHGGNWIEGEARWNKYDILVMGIEGQVDYFIQNYPKRKGVKTHIISGDDHEGWYVQREHINIGKVMENRAKEVGRDDLIDLGYMERDIEFKKGRGGSIIRAIHAGGGSTYAISYTSQKYVESLQGGEKPAIILVGHFHKFDWSYVREVHVIQGGCTQDQTPFLRKKRIQAMPGGCIVEAKQDRMGNFVRVKVEWFPFYDKKFYQYHWK